MYSTGREFFYHDEAARIESGGKSLDICADPRRLEDQMLALSPADAHLTKEFIRLLSGKSIMSGASLKPAEMFGLMDNIKMAAALLPLMGVFQEVWTDDDSGVCATLPGPFSTKRRPVLHRRARVADAALPHGCPCGLHEVSLRRRCAPRRIAEGRLPDSRTLQAARW